MKRCRGDPWYLVRVKHMIGRVHDALTEQFVARVAGDRCLKCRPIDAKQSSTAGGQKKEDFFKMGTFCVAQQLTRLASNLSESY